MRLWIPGFARSLRRRFSPPPLILLYHRIAEPQTDSQQLCVSPSHFSAQLASLRAHAEILPLAEFCGHLQRNERPPRAVVITFDDGYVDNLQNGLPALENAGAPATIFVTTGFIGSNREFWWDQLESLLLFPGKFPEKIVIEIGVKKQAWGLGEHVIYHAGDFARFRSWTITNPEDPTRRHTLYRDLCGILQPLPQVAQDHVLAQLQAQIRDHQPAGDSRRCMTVGELTLLAKNPLIEIGAHSVTHRFLSSATRVEQAAELRESKTALENLLTRNIRGLAFPHGNYTWETIEETRAAGFDFAFTTEPRCIRRSEKLFEIPRFVVGDWDADQFEKRLAKWRRTVA